MAIHRGEHRKPEEDRQLAEFVESGKSWVLISAILKRSVKSLQDRYRYIKRRRSDMLRT
jgi:hypothetical protein